MDQNSDIFLSVFYKMIDSFTIHFQIFLTSVEEDENLKKKAMENPENIFFNNFFPYALSHYKTIKKTIISLAEFDLEQSLNSLLDIFSKLISRKELGMYALLLQSTHIDISNQILSQELCYHFSILLTTELLTSIIQKFGTANKEELITSIAFSLVDPELPIKISEEIVKNWSKILAVVSSKNFLIVSRKFIEMVDKCNKDMLFILISKVRLDARLELGVDFLYTIVSVLRKIQRKKELTNTILFSVATLISSCAIKCEPLQKLSDLVFFELDPKLKDGVYALTASLFPHISNSDLRCTVFYKKRVYAHADNPKKTKRSLLLFWTKVKGGYSSLSEEDSLSFIGTTGEDAKEMPKVFMNIFFKKSDFSICPKIFENVLIHLISIDFTYFIQNMLPSFLMLQITDQRFITLLSCIPKLNSEVFLERAVSNITQNDIDALNAMVRGKVCQYMDIIQPSANKSVLLKIGSVSWRNIDQCDQKITHFLDECGLSDYEMTQIYFNKPDMNYIHNIETNLLKSIPYLFQESDYFQVGFIEKLIYLCCHKNGKIIDTAIKITKKIVENEKLATELLRTVMKIIKTNTSDEVFFTCVSIIEYALSKKTLKLSTKEVYKIEIIATVGLISIYPVIRLISMQLLVYSNNILNNRGIISYINTCFPIIEKIATQKITNNINTDMKVEFQWAISCHYYDIWLIFLEEILRVVLAANYTPILNNIDKYIHQFINNIENVSPSLSGLLLIYFTSRVDYQLYKDEVRSYQIPLFDPHVNTNNKSEECSQIIIKLLKKNTPEAEKICFQVMRNLELSHINEVIKVCSVCKFEQLAMATTALIAVSKSSGNNIELSNRINDIMRPFLGSLHAILTNEGLNGPRSISWTPEQEEIVIKSRVIAENYCDLLKLCIIKQNKEIKWPVSSRELAINYLINWISTKSPELEPLRQKAKTAVVSLARRCQIITTPPISYETFLNVFADIESSGKRVLTALLENQTDILLNCYCDACLTTKRGVSILFFDALFVIFKYERIYTPQQVAMLFIIGRIAKVLQHERADEFLEKFKKYVYGGDGGIAEIVFKEGFRILNTKIDDSPVREIIFVLRSLVSDIRLLPNHNVIVTDSPRRFRIYTPYNFLVALMNTAENIYSDLLIPFSTIFLDLLKSQDHVNIVPEFIMEWSNPKIKYKLLTSLINQKAPHIFRKLLSRCSFAYYLYFSEKGMDIKEEAWPIHVITKSLEERSYLIEHISPLIHTAFLYYSINKHSLLNVLCKQLDIKPPESTKMEDIIVTVRSFIEISKEYPNINCLEEWGTESLKWVFRSNKIAISTISMKIYNELMTPLNNTVISGIIKTAIYYMEKYLTETIIIADFIKECFKFFSNIFPEHEKLTFDFTVSFLDCQDFLSCCKQSIIEIFFKCISSPVFTIQSLGNISQSIVRSLLPSIEQDQKSQKVLSFIAKKWKSTDLTLVTIPLQELRGGFIPNKASYKQLVDEASQTTLIKTIENYSIIIDSASEQLADKIFTISELALPKVADENVYLALSRLYTASLSMVTTLKSARKLIIKIAKFAPQAAKKSSYAFINWARSVEDVIRSLNRLVEYNENDVAFTDCSTLASVENLIGKAKTPKIIPFSTQQSIIESMKNVCASTPVKSDICIRRNDSSRLIGKQKNVDASWEIKPLNIPTKILEGCQTNTTRNDFIVSEEEFDINFSQK